MTSAFDWSAWPGQGGVMCPSYRVTRDERDVTRGRANTLRLAVTGQLGADAFTSDGMAETMKLCVSCKACRRECPTGVDMAKMKIEVLAARTAAHGLSFHSRLVGWLPRYAPIAARLPWLFNLRDRLPGAAALSERIAQFSARRTLPRWRRDWFRDPQRRPLSAAPAEGRDVVLFADTFNRYFEPENLHAAMKVLEAGGYRVEVATPADGSRRPLCCGRTFLAVGRVDEARREAERTLAALAPLAERGLPVIGLEPSCIFTFRDEIPALTRDVRTRTIADRAVLFEEFLAHEAGSGRLALPLKPRPGEGLRKALLHGHCHQKAFGAMGTVEMVLRLVPDLQVETIKSSCCGMAGSFGFHAETIDASLAMGELSLLPAVRKAPADAIVVADGTSCRHQIRDGAGRDAVHVARVLADSL
jgi:Fe-S oxidoreductase